jgi:hypothetical protein
MIRYTLFVITVLATAATALAAGSVSPAASDNVTVIAMNSAYPILGPLVVVPCKVEDCSDTE